MTDEVPDFIPEGVTQGVVRAMTDDAVLYAFRYLETARATVQQMLVAADSLAETDPEKSDAIRREAERRSQFNANLARSLEELNISVNEE